MTPPSTRPSPIVAAGAVAYFSRSADGISAVVGSVAMKVTALRDDIVRVRLCVGGRWPEDASWTVLSAAREGKTKVEPIDADGVVGFQTPSLAVQIERRTGRLTVLDSAGTTILEDAEGWPAVFYPDGGFSVFKALQPGEKYFGLGDKTGPLCRNGQAFVCWNTDPMDFQESTDPIYKSIPFVLGMRGPTCFGLLLDNTTRSNFDFGKRLRNVVGFGAESGPLDYYVIVGNHPKQIMSAYAYLTGRPPMPPMWALGYQQSRYSYMTSKEVRDVAARLRQDKIPADAIYFDIDFQDRMRPFTYDQESFEDFVPLIKELRATNFRAVVITDPHLPVVTDGSYEPYTTGAAGNHFVRKEDGSVFAGAMWGGVSAYPDFTRQATRDWWGTLYLQFARDGVSGFWNDMNEPVVADDPSGTMPLSTTHRIEDRERADRTATHAEIHNVYGLLNTRATYDGLRALQPEQRPFVLTRATFAGGHRYAATWTGDNSATWNHLRLGINMLLNLGLSGFALAGADIGGFFGSASPQLLTRWFQIGAFTPLFRNHAFKDSAAREPWVHGEPHTSIRRRFVAERYRLMPYIYGLAEEAARTGVPIIRPMFLEFPNMVTIPHWYIRDPAAQFMLGSNLLVAPAPYPDMPDAYDVTFPPGTWYDYWTGQKVPETETHAGPLATIRVTPTLESIPVYARGASIIPRQPPVQSTAEAPDGPLELSIYPGPNCHCWLYADEGDGFAYLEDGYVRQGFNCLLDGETTKIGFGLRQGSHSPWWNEIALTIHDVMKMPTEISCSFGSVEDAEYDPDSKTLRLVVPDTATYGAVTLGNA